jgi:hypothetical protein
MDDFQADPGYQFRKEEGEQALDRKLQALGMGESGQAVKEAIRFNQGNADQTYNDAFNRNRTEEQARYNMLSNEQKQLIDLLTGQRDIGVDATGNIAGLRLGSANINSMTTGNRNDTLTELLAMFS